MIHARVQKGPSVDWGENFELLSGGNVREVNIDGQFSVTKVESEHQMKPFFIFFNFFYFIFYQPPFGSIL